MLILTKYERFVFLSPAIVFPDSVDQKSFFMILCLLCSFICLQAVYQLSGPCASLLGDVTDFLSILKL